MKNKIDIEVLKRYLKGDFTSNDYYQVKSWFECTEDSNQLDEIILENWTEFKEQVPEKDLNYILDKIQRHIYKEEKKKKRTIWQYYKEIAAVVMFPILFFTSYLLLNNSESKSYEAQLGGSWAEIYSPPGARTQFKLPDGTIGYLNGSSSIQYPTDFSVRDVNVKGEVYFDVAHKDNKDFTVHTYGVDISVLGTKFNVAAFPEDKVLEVVLEQGEVVLKGKKNSFKEKLLPDERFVLSEDQKKGIISKVDAEYYTTWKEGKLVFRNETFSSVLKRLERWYNVDFVVKDEQLKNYIYQATFKDETLEEAMRLLSYTVPMVYEIKSRKLNQDGSYSKREVNIWEKVN